MEEGSQSARQQDMFMTDDSELGSKRDCALVNGGVQFTTYCTKGSV